MSHYPLEIILISWFAAQEPWEKQLLVCFVNLMCPCWLKCVCALTWQITQSGRQRVKLFVMFPPLFWSYRPNIKTTCNNERDRESEIHFIYLEYYVLSSQISSWISCCFSPLWVLKFPPVFCEIVCFFDKNCWLVWSRHYRCLAGERLHILHIWMEWQRH